MKMQHRYHGNKYKTWYECRNSNNTFGPKTSAQELVYLINGQYPANTIDFTSPNNKRHKYSTANKF